MFFQRVHSGIFWLLLLFATPAAALVPAPDALREQGIRLENGESGIRDPRRAYKLFCLAALEGDSRAAFHVGMMHLNGVGRATNKARAAGWLEQAEKLGDPDAGAALEARLASVSSAADPNCPLVKPQPTPAEIRTWVKLLAPYYKISPGLVLSVIKVESNFNARAKSPKNAFGLMQLIQPTAERFNVRDVWNPLQNIKGGMAYLAWLKEHFQHAKKRKPGKVRLMLAAYNAGEHAVKRHNGIPPYDETRKYVKRVVRIYTNYLRARNARNKSSGQHTLSKKNPVWTTFPKKSWNYKFRTSHTSSSSIQ